jgi:GT2 family glycosyltransferase/glycosyltransferase involved in cell wall biosynthesis/SAM-dependent methyltransferase
MTLAIHEQEVSMSGECSHQSGLKLFKEGLYETALREFARALGEEETSDRWNDWATVEVAMDRAGEAEEGFRRALEIDPAHAQAAANLGGLLFKLKRYGEARGFLQMSLRGLEESQKPVALRLLQEIHAKQAACPQTKLWELSAYLHRFAGSQENSKSYFKAHLDRYLTTLELLPSAAAGERLLELGAAFHHLTPALVRWKGYGDIRCSDLWGGDAQCQRRVVSGDGQEEFVFTVDNFDVQRSPWPYPDSTFDVVLCCEMLEHLVHDPMQVFSEVNRILKESGRLLLTTPNIASAKSVESVLRGDSPYVYGKYELGGLATDRHNREYTPGEVARILQAAGFDVENLQTRNSWWTDKGSVLRHLAAAGFSIASRGDNVFCLARKTGTVRDRYPTEFYLFDGTQSQRRTPTATHTTEPEAQTSGSKLGPLKILIVHEVLPHPDQNGCDVRLMQILSELLAQGHKLTYLARDGVDRERYTLPLEQLGIQVFSHDLERLGRFDFDDPPAWSLEAVLKEGQFDLAILFHWFWTALSLPEQYIDEIRHWSPQTRVAVLSDDQHGLRERRLAELSGLWTNLERARDFGQREFEVYRHADMVLAISEADRQGMLTAAPSLEIEILPMVAEGMPSGVEFARRADVLFLGNFTNAVNLEGFDWLLKEVWPRVAPRLPEAQLHLAGYGLPQGLTGERVVALGYAKDLDAVLAQHRVFVSPVRYCTGIQTKVLAALVRGIPVVTTPAAAEGLNLQHKKECLVAATAEDFAREIVRAYCDEDLWQKLSQGGASLVKNEFSRERLAAQTRRLCERVRELEPKRYDASHVWSVFRIEREFPEVLTRPTSVRIPLRIQAHCTLAEYLLGEGKPAAALEQLRHVFTVLRGDLPRSGFFARLMLDLDRCYRELRDQHQRPPADFVAEAKACLAPVDPSQPSMGASQKCQAKRHRHRLRPEISVIIPTYNRCAVLASCLAALEQQSLAKERFEVIVIDDGSTDGTEQFCRGISMSFTLVYLRQSNAGAGAARKLGSEVARGKYLLLFNDDTLAAPELLVEHLNAQHEYAPKKYAVLGDFRYPTEAGKRALTSFLATRPFLFPQVNMKAGFYRESWYFIASNLSVRREAVLDAGSFDPQFRVAEDTELGARLEQKGYRILYRPKALAWHDHLDFTSTDLLKRARAYAPADLLLFKKHPRLLGAGTGPFGRLDDDWAAKTKDLVDRSRYQVAEWTKAIARFDKLDFAPLFSMRKGDATEAEIVLRTFDQIVPQVHWFHLFESILELRGERIKAPPRIADLRLSIGD